MLAQVGIESSIKSYTWATYIGRIQQQRDTANAVWTIFNSRQADPSLAVIDLNAKDIKPGGGNFAQWNNARASTLMDEARSTAIQAKRKPMYHEIQQIVHDEVPVIPLYNALGVDLWYQYVQGLHSLESLTGTMGSVEDAWLNK
jgi:ABC-type transport system substrate-binding protein